MDNFGCPTWSPAAKAFRNSITLQDEAFLRTQASQRSFLHEGGPVRHQRKRRRVIRRQRIDKEASVRGDIILKHIEMSSDDTSLKKLPRRAHCSGCRIEVNDHEFSVGPNIENLPAVTAPARLGVAFGNLDSRARARKGLHENSSVGDPLSVRRELRLCPSCGKWNDLVVLSRINRQRRISLVELHEYQVDISCPVTWNHPVPWHQNV